MGLWSEVAQREFDMPDYYHDLSSWVPNQHDGLFILFIAILLTILRIRVQKLFLSHAANNNISSPKKYAESCWKTIFYSTVWIWGLYLVYYCEWFPETNLAWKNYPDIPLEPNLRYYYLYQLAFYFHSLYAHLVIETKRSDFYPLLAHHLVTIYLIYFSYMVKFYRIGLLVLICHDTNDVLFEIGKIFVYRDYKRLQAPWFVLIILSWMTTRLGIYPFKVMWSAWFESAANIPWDVFPFFYGFNHSLQFLLLLHIYWFGLMLRMLGKYIRGEPIRDSREENKKEVQEKMD